MTPDGQQTLLILGASGDLTARLLLPGLGGLLSSGRVSGVGLVGSAMGDWDDTRWRSRVAESFAAGGGTGPAADAVARGTRYVRADATSEDDWRRLFDACRGRPVIYFALAPQITERACEVLTRLEMPADTRLVMEKPFGTDAASAEALNLLLSRLVREDHVHRVDHFLGMSTVLNLVGVRWANAMFEPVLNAGHVQSVDIVFEDTLGLEGRAGYYESAGALVDMIQSHLLQVLSLVVMEPPSTLGARDLGDGRAQALRATRVWDDDPATCSFRARYTAGEVGGRRLPSYVDEEGIPAASTTETLAEVVLAVDTWRWAGVPFRARSGKAIGAPRQEVAITFKRPPLLPTGFTGFDRPNCLRIGLTRPSGSLEIDMNVNGPGDPAELDPITLQARLGAGDLPEYGQVLDGILHDDPTLSVRADMVVDSWRIVDPVLGVWREDRVPLEEYPAGSAGPPGWPLAGRPATLNTGARSRQTPAV